MIAFQLIFATRIIVDDVNDSISAVHDFVKVTVA